MKYLISSDLHGSYYYAKKLKEAFERERADKLIILGDIYNHGPRNPLPQEYSPGQVASLLNDLSDKLIVIKGNCDSVVDTMISNFDFLESMVITINDKTVFLTHGHVYNKDNLPKTKFDCIIYGHFHTCFIEKNGDMIIANAGSLALPKQDTKNSFIILKDGELVLKDIDGNLIRSETI